MYLAKVDADAFQLERREDVEDQPNAAHEAHACGGKWRDWPASTISHHGRICCDMAREWVLAMDVSQLGAAAPVTGPRWLRQRYPWGPSKWPLHWCEAVRKERLDCGAHAAISHQIFEARGVASFPAQLVQRFTPEATQHWGEKWGEHDTPAGWIDGDLIYHEGCAVAAGPGDSAHPGEIRLWDASAGWWINPDQSPGYGSLVSVRVLAPPGAALIWGGRTLPPNTWTTVD